MLDTEILYRSLAPTNPKEFSDSFNAVKKSAFRLEMFDLYTISEETEFYKSFLSGASEPPADFNQDWLTFVRTATSKGAFFERVRLVREPVHDYIKFEIAWGYSRNIEAGEKIRLIIYNQLPVFKTSVPILNDFWLFDDKICYLMEYDFIGQFLGIKRLPQEYLGLYLDLKKEALEKSVDIKNSKLWSYASETLD